MIREFMLDDSFNKLKRYVAKRKHKRTCDYCNCNFKKGDVYYQYREIYSDIDSISSSDVRVCPRCKYNYERHKKRYREFKTNCKHPKFAVDTNYIYIPGEAVMMPNYDYCILCGKNV